jgi:predicted AAA+ superfamily ATPase
MPHSRARLAMARLEKKLRFARVVTIQGPRQCGKSYLARVLYPRSHSDSQFVTLDRKDQRILAASTPGLFLDQFDSRRLLVIDEAQKAPDLFDEIKARVDQDERPGQYLLLGSTEFSREMKVRETLTGRVSRLRLFPLCLAEAWELGAQAGEGFSARPRITRSQLLESMRNGGLPGIFAVRSEEETEQKLQEWIDITVHRDLLQFRGVRPDPDLALEILMAIARLEIPDLTAIRGAVKADQRRVNTHLQFLEQLFAIQRVRRHPLGIGKDCYYLCDAGVAAQLGAGLQRQLETQLLLELNCRLQYSGRSKIRNTLYHFRSSKNAILPFVLETPEEVTLFKIFLMDSVDIRKLRAFESMRKRIQKQDKELGQPARKIREIAFYTGQTSRKLEGVQLLPVECMG